LSPTTEQLILLKLTGIEERQIEFEERQIKQGEAIASITGKMESDTKYCTDCKGDIYRNFDTVYERQHQADIERANLKGVNEGVQVAEARDDKILTRRIKIIGFAFAAGASLAQIYASWAQIKQWLVIVASQ